MAALANVALTDAFDTWRTRINQLVIKANENEGSVEVGFARANDANSIARSGFGQANTARDHANVSFGGANTARGHANAAFLQANTARDQANAAFTRANSSNSMAVGNTLSSVFTLRSSRTKLNFIPSGSLTVNVDDDSAGDRVNVTLGVGATDIASPFLRANLAHAHANVAYLQANTARDHANVSFAQANTARDAANGTSVAFPQANTARNQANDAYTRANTKVSGTGATSQGTWTTSGWSTVIKIPDSFAIEWLKTGSGYSYGIGVTANNGFYFGNSANDDNISPVNYFFRVSSNAIVWNGFTVWHAGNDGAGSGLDADTLDGVQAASFATVSDLSSYVLTSSYTAADVLTKIKTVDGVGSGLDADLLDGQSSAFYQPASTAITTSNIGSQSVSFATSAGSATSATSATTFTSTTQNSQFNSIGVGTAGSGTAGEIRATNNITAYYSDERLKDIEGTIPNAMDLIMQLSGIYFRNNEVANEYGYTDDSRQVGVIAQQVQKVLPEAVAPAPFDTKFDDGVMSSISGEEYLTVRMERLIPLLIEGMKAQKLQIDKLEAEIAKLKGN
jgi:hypothetical protein